MSVENASEELWNRLQGTILKHELAYCEKECISWNYMSEDLIRNYCQKTRAWKGFQRHLMIQFKSNKLLRIKEKEKAGKDIRYPRSWMTFSSRKTVTKTFFFFFFKHNSGEICCGRFLLIYAQRKNSTPTSLCLRNIINFLN